MRLPRGKSGALRAMMIFRGSFPIRCACGRGRQSHPRRRFSGLESV